MIDIEKLLSRWSEPVETTTSRGSATVKTGRPGGVFWDAWRNSKFELQNAGISPTKDGEGNWLVRWYQRAPEVVAPCQDAAPAPLNPSDARPLTRKEFVWSDEQELIFEWFRGGQGNLVVVARAGTGKTTTIKFAFSLAKGKRKLYLVFNKKNQVEAKAKILDPSVDVATMHSIGKRIVEAVWTFATLDDSVEVDRILEICGDKLSDEGFGAIKKLVAFAKNTLIAPTIDQLKTIIDEQDLACDYTEDFLAEKALAILELSKTPDAQNRYSFNDMVWLPVVMGWVRAEYDLVVVDEAQDMNLLQLTMARQLCKDRLCVVGDDRQAIYTFRGALLNSLAEMKRVLDAKQLGLTVTRRCPKAVVRLAQQIVPDFRAADDAPEGEIFTMNEASLEFKLKVGDAVLSRANAPLMPICLSLLRQGIPARVEGKDVGAQLRAIVNGLKGKSIPDLLGKINRWSTRQITRALKSKNPDAKISAIKDQAGVLIALAEVSQNVAEVDKRLVRIFEDSTANSAPAVVLSSVHKAKGLEWDNVFVLSDTFRSGATLSEGAANEEANIYYVAVTRSKNRLTLVSKGA